MADFVDAAVVARILDVSRRQVAQLAESEPTFPSSRRGESGYRLWPSKEVEGWAAWHGREGARYEPPRATFVEPGLWGLPERITDELHEMFELGCDEAFSLHHDGLS